MEFLQRIPHLRELPLLRLLGQRWCINARLADYCHLATWLWRLSTHVFAERQSTRHMPGVLPGRFPGAWSGATSPTTFVFPRWDRRRLVRGLSNDKVLVQAFPDKTQN